MTRQSTFVVSAVVTFLAIAAAANADGLPPNWPMAPAELERRFASGDFTIAEVKGAGGGVTGAVRLKIAYADGRILKVKWKAVPDKSADGWNNSPRKELAAYALQHWLFDQNDYNVPTIVPHCIPMEGYKAVNPRAKPSLAGSACVLGLIAVWLEDVTAPEEIYDEKRFENDAAYARYMADFNVLTYLIEHRDGRPGNLLLSTVAGDPRVFAVDNGIAFDPFPWNPLVRNWHRIRVPWLRRTTIDKLRLLDRKTLDELAVVAELDAGKDGVFRVATAGANMDPDKGVRRHEGRVQFGLTREEIDEVHERIVKLLEKVDSGKIPVH